MKEDNFGIDSEKLFNEFKDFIEKEYNYYLDKFFDKEYDENFMCYEMKQEEFYWDPYMTASKKLTKSDWDQYDRDYFCLLCLSYDDILSDDYCINDVWKNKVEYFLLKKRLDKLKQL